MEIVPNLFLVPKVFGGTYLITEPNGLTLVDAGLSCFSRRIVTFIRSLGYVPQDLNRILVTHADLDHVGGLATLRAISGARVCASPIESQALEKGRSSRRLDSPDGRCAWLRGCIELPRLSFQPQPVDEVLEDGQTLPIWGGLQVIATPGHTAGHVSFFAPAHGVLFAGDAIAYRFGRLRRPYRASSWDYERGLQSYRRLQRLQPQIICLGHGSLGRGPVIRARSGLYPWS